MKTRKIVSAVLCLAVLAGFTSCTDSKKVSEVEAVLDKYVEALRNMDAGDVQDITDWDDDDRDYLQMASIMRPDTQNESVTDFYDAVADTISVDYKAEDIEFKDGKASVRVTYEIVDWEEAFENYAVTENARKAVKNTDETIRVKGKISFVQDGKEWKISKITELDKVFAFIGIFRTKLPDPTPVPTPVVPTDTEPTSPDPVKPDPTDTVPTGTDFPDSFGRAADAYVQILEQNRDAIMEVEDYYNIDPVGLYDIDGNGLPELYFISDAGNDYSAVLHVYEYAEYMGEAREVITVPDILAKGQASGNYLIFVTDRELVVTYTYGESYFFHVETEIYTILGGGAAFKWDKDARYARETYSEYDPETDTETVEKTYYLHDYTIDESTYYSGMKDIVSRTVMVLGRQFNLRAEDPEYGLLSKPSAGLFDYYTAIDYLKTLA